MPMIPWPANLSRLAADRSGLAMLEFAFTLPLVLGLGLYGLEAANLALVNLRVSQIALALADNASRVGAASTLNTQQLREVDINDVLQAARYQGKSIGLTTYGRITLSSLENTQRTDLNDTAPTQRIHWQRCIGLKGQTQAESLFNSNYGVAATSPSATYQRGATYDRNAGVDTDSSTNDNSASHPGSLAAQGMGDQGAQVTSPATMGTMFVEVNYLYRPLVTGYFLGPATRLHYIASFIVRDSRDFKEIYNPSPASTASTCDKYTS